MPSISFRVALAVAAPVTTSARLGSGLVDLTSLTFDKFVQDNPGVMVDFMNSSSANHKSDTDELMSAIRTLRSMGRSTPIARVDVNREPELVRRFMEVGCAEDPEAQLCGSELPQLLWFKYGHPTQYHRHLRSASNIQTFAVVLDRSAVTSVAAVPETFPYSQVVLAKVPKDSRVWQEVEVAASKYMDTVAFLHVEAEETNITWIANDTVVDYFTDPIEATALSKWVRTHVTQSEDLPENPMDDGSLVVVGRNFDEQVLRASQDVMLIAYAPWCGFCRKLMPVWAEFAHKATSDNLVIAKMDGTRNRSPIPGFHWTTFPTIIYLRKGGTEPIHFEGTNRTLEAFMDFASRHSSFGERSDEIAMLQGNFDVEEEEL